MINSEENMVFDFTSLIQVCHQVASSLLASSSCIKPVGFIKLHQVCWLHQVASSLRKSDLMYLDISRLAVSKFLKQLASSLWIKSLDNQVA